MKLKPIAIYLPQFHPIPENDKAWGEGFTEWTNVKKAKPLFKGHYQPHTPHEDVGYYDLRDPEVMVRQAEMAKKYGIYGFAFYHYWFNGKQLLETPLNNMLKTGKPDFPFLYIWANEPWSKRWDGSENEIIQEQTYSDEDDVNHIRYLCENVFSDKRYITIDGKPVFIVYRTELLPDINNTAQVWREEAKKFGFKDLYLIRVENFVDDINPLDIGFDAGLDFTPDSLGKNYPPNLQSLNDNLIQDYKYSISNSIVKSKREFPWYRCVYPSWDNSARKSNKAIIFLNNSIELFRLYFYAMCQITIKNINLHEKFLFINAWNEWAEGCHIEPDEKNGYSYLKSISEILNKKDKTIENEYINFIENSIDSIIKENLKLKIIEEKYTKLVKSRAFLILEKTQKSFRKIKKRIKL